MDPTKRILDLAAQGLSDAQIADTLNREGITNQKGGGFNDNSVRSRRLRAEKQPQKIVTSGMPETSDNSPVISDKSGISDTMREEIRSIVREEIQASTMFQILQISQIDLPPEVSTDQKILSEKGHKQAPVKRPKIAGTVDAELMRRLEEWRKERGISLSRALDTALWHLLGKPKLSFEMSDTSDGEE